MTFWNIGDEEHEDERFRAVPGGFGLYHGAGSYCLGQVRGRRIELPAEWFVPDHFVRGWDNGHGPAIAKGLVSVGLWEQVRGGYRFAWIRDSNTPDRVREVRKRWRTEKGAGDK